MLNWTESVPSMPDPPITIGLADKDHGGTRCNEAPSANQTLQPFSSNCKKHCLGQVASQQNRDLTNDINFSQSFPVLPDTIDHSSPESQGLYNWVHSINSWKCFQLPLLWLRKLCRSSNNNRRCAGGVQEEHEPEPNILKCNISDKAGVRRALQGMLN